MYNIKQRAKEAALEENLTMSGEDELILFNVAMKLRASVKVILASSCTNSEDEPMHEERKTVMDGNPTLPQELVEEEIDAEPVGEVAADNPTQGRAPK